MFVDSYIKSAYFLSNPEYINCSAIIITCSQRSEFDSAHLCAVSAKTPSTREDSSISYALLWSCCRADLHITEK